MDTSARLQEIKRQILASRSEMQYLFPEEDAHKKDGQSGYQKETAAQIKSQEEPCIKAESALAQKVSHAKYGIGVIVSEDDDNVTVRFEDYGEKEFLKCFCELEYLD